MALISWFGKPINWVVRHKERIALVAIGHTGKQVEEIVFDWLIYGSVVAYTATKFGPIWGSLAAFCVMAPISAIMCFLYLKLYDKFKKDFLGLEALKELREGEAGAGWFERAARAIARRGDIPAFLALSIYGDPFMVTVYLRKGTNTYAGFNRRDWSIFWASVIFSNGYWTLRWTVIIELFRLIWKIIT